MGPAHPLTRALDADAAGRARAIRDLVLGPLPEADVDELVADTVHRTLAPEAAPLAHLVHEKTGGNPFFVIQFLTALHQQGLIAFDRGAGRWRWDLARIRAKGYTDNVVELMVGKLQRAPARDAGGAQAGRLPRRQPCDADTLGDRRRTRSATTRSRPALEEDLLLQVDGDAIGSRTIACRRPPTRSSPSASAPTVHLDIGRRLLAAHARRRSSRSAIFDVVNQLNRGAALITSPGRARAGRRAQPARRQARPGVDGLRLGAASTSRPAPRCSDEERWESRATSSRSRSSSTGRSASS